jgi:hypothetical protein
MFLDSTEAYQPYGCVEQLKVLREEITALNLIKRNLVTENISTVSSQHQ